MNSIYGIYLLKLEMKLVNVYVARKVNKVNELVESDLDSKVSTQGEHHI